MCRNSQIHVLDKAPTGAKPADLQGEMVDGGILFPDRADRERALDMSQRLSRTVLVCFGVLAIPVVFSVPHCGPQLLIPLAGMLAGTGISSLVARRMQRPEWALGVGWLLSQLSLAGVIVAAHDPEVPYLLPLPIIPLLGAAVVWSKRGVIAGAVWTIGLMVAASLIFHPDPISSRPSYLALPVALAAAISIVGIAIREVDIVSRGTAVVDRLTGALNRAAMQARLSELAAQSRHTAQRVALIVFDIDHFKEINDARGHSVGDAILRGVAERLRGGLDADASLYRYGGEEFVVVLPGSNPPEATGLAERLRRRVAAEPIEGIPVTVSGGVAVSAPGPLDPDRLFIRADSALYTAKHEGRNRVRCAPPERTASVEHGRRSGRSGGRRSRDAIASSATVQAAEAAHSASSTGNWLVPSSLHREQLVAIAELSSLLSNRLAFLLVVLAVAVGIPWFGWEPLVPIFLLIAPWHFVLQRAKRLRRPEFWGLAGIATSIVAAGLATVSTREPALFALDMIVVVLFGAAAAYPPRGAGLLLGLTAVMMLVTGLVVDAREVADNPTVVATPIAIAVCATLIGQALRRSSVEHRSAALVDKLTGALNRAALEARVPEVAYQAELLSEPVSVLVADLDRFKQVNDRYGHARGDEVLAGVAQRIRSELRAFDAVYRVGGEEFVVILRGTGARSSPQIAERVRAAVASAPVKGVDVTVSIGVAAAPGGRFDYDEAFRRADTALLEAKEQGRNRVVLAPSDDESLAAA